MTKNPYLRWLGTDFGLCKPVIAGDALTAIHQQVVLRVYQTMGTGPKPTLYMDLEQLQVVDYGAFEIEENIEIARNAFAQCGSPKTAIPELYRSSFNSSKSALSRSR